ncbi:hypothetical protein AAG570_001075 [Ranatra chinensis]|uniref:Uncharacterized protein n=1 Tax=Ranatra chinensis TaxID=642074 RepID=A0ABD0YBJ3_9HEMI
MGRRFHENKKQETTENERVSALGRHLLLETLYHKLMMASKLPNMFYENKKQETTERGDYESEPSSNGVGTGRNKVKITVGRGDLGARYECRANNDALTSPMKAWLEVEVNENAKEACVLGHKPSSCTHLVVNHAVQSSDAPHDVVQKRRRFLLPAKRDKCSKNVFHGRLWTIFGVNLEAAGKGGHPLATTRGVGADYSNIFHRIIMLLNADQEYEVLQDPIAKLTPGRKRWRSVWN